MQVSFVGLTHNLCMHRAVHGCVWWTQISFVGLTQDAAEEQAQQKGFPLGITKTSFKANSKVGVDLVKPLADFVKPVVDS